MVFSEQRRSVGSRRHALADTEPPHLGDAMQSGYRDALCGRAANMPRSPILRVGDWCSWSRTGDLAIVPIWT